jgi:hypothetical protein
VKSGKDSLSTAELIAQLMAAQHAAMSDSTKSSPLEMPVKK